MIEKIVEIKNVGAFDNHQATGDVLFRKLTVVNGGNGDGKTTLVAILRSLKEQSPGPLIERRTLGSTDPQRVHVRLGGGSAIFDGTRWSSRCGPLEIFDEEFVARNVHGEDGVDTDQRRGMYSVIIGEQGTQLRESIVALNDRIAGLTRQLATAANELLPFQFGVPLVEFKRLSADMDVDAKIAAKEKEIAGVMRRAEVSAAAGLEVVPVPEFDVAAWERSVGETVQSLSAQAALRVRNRIEQRLDAQAPAWLLQGLHYGVDHDCPFCGLGTAENPLIRDYQGYFSEGYRDLRERVQRLDREAAAQLGGGPSARLEAALARNAERVRFWHEFVPITLPALDGREVERAVKAAGEAISAVLRRKNASPLEALAVAPEESVVVFRLTEVVRQLNEYNAAVAAANDRIARYKGSLTAANPDQVRLDLNRLKATKARHLPDVMQRVDGHTAIENQKALAEGEKSAARRQLDEYAEAVIARYEEKINGYLAAFGATFRLGSLTENYAGGQPGCQYGILLRDMAVPLAGSPGTVRFKTALSGGDKRSLALAFYFTRLDECPNLGDTRVVLDDPMCSLDRSRRFATARRIVRLARDAKQVVLLSHDPVFLRLVWDETRDAGIETTSLSVERHGNTARVVPWDIEEATAPDFYKQLQAIDAFIINGPGDPLSLKRSFRPLLETHLRQSRPRAFGPKVWLGDMINLIRDAAPGSNLVPLQSLLPDLTDINSFTRDDHHGANTGATPVPPDLTELRTMARRTLSVLGWS